MPIERVFLGWDRPCLTAAVEFLVDRYESDGKLDLGGLVIVVPGGRAGRRLLELLVEIAEKRSPNFFPPRIVTVGTVPELLFENSRPVAGNLARQLAWAATLKSAESETLRIVVARRPDEEDLLGWLALAATFERLHLQLAAEGFLFADVLDHTSSIEHFRDEQRWKAVSRLQQAYLEHLDQLCLVDPQYCRLEAIRKSSCRTDKDIVLVCLADMNKILCQMLDQVADRVTALIHAPQDLADHFDEYGCIETVAWREAKIEISTPQVRIVEGPAEQAVAVIEVIASYGGRFSAEQITIGVPDEEVIPHLEQLSHEYELPVRSAAGVPVNRSAPALLLRGIGEYLDGRRVASFAALLRHPDLETWLVRNLANENAGGKIDRADWLGELDSYQSKHLQRRLQDRWFRKGSSYPHLRGAFAKIENLLADLVGPARLLDAWTEPIVELLVKVFATEPLDRNDSRDRMVLVACEAIRQTLAEHSVLDERLLPRLNASAALRLTLRQLERTSIPPESDRAAVEILGWLELQLDDAPALVVTGMSEGFVPQSVTADAFLPNGLRTRLGLPDNDCRYARDAYALSAILASRPEVTFISGRRTSSSDPLIPSRLLFACDSRTIAERTRVFFGSDRLQTDVDGLPRKLRAKGRTPGFVVPRPEPADRPITALRVTAFRDYLACPYRFYLRHVLDLKTSDDSAEELDDAAFGGFVHELLDAFGRSPLTEETNGERIRDFLDGTWDRLAKDRFGSDPLPAVRVQLEQVRSRSNAFAHWQAQWSRQGWRIEHTELPSREGDAKLLVDGQPMYLLGRIDRIDVNDSTGERIIFDYKTAESSKTPESTHRSRGSWVDLQLPLYRHIATNKEIAGPVKLGYIVLPKDTGKVGALISDWTEEDLAAAAEVAFRIIRQVRDRIFWPPTTPAPPFSKEFAAICQSECGLRNADCGMEEEEKT